MSSGKELIDDQSPFKDGTEGVIEIDHDTGEISLVFEYEIKHVVGILAGVFEGRKIQIARPLGHVGGKGKRWQSRRKQG